jgi:hypothetical protein
MPIVHDSLSQEIPRADRKRLYLYRIASGSPNIRYMDHLLDFIEERYQLLPRESPSQQICFRPQFAAFVGATQTTGGLQISLFGEEFLTGPVQRGRFPNWRKYVVRHSDYLFTAQSLISEAYQHRVDADAAGKWTFEEELQRLAEFALVERL